MRQLVFRWKTVQFLLIFPVNDAIIFLVLLCNNSVTRRHHSLQPGLWCWIRMGVSVVPGVGVFIGVNCFYADMVLIICANCFILWLKGFSWIIVVFQWQ